MKGARRVRFREHWSLAVIAAASAFVAGCRRAELPRLDRVTVCLPYDFSTLDPHARDTNVNNMITANMYETLVAADAEMKIEPALAERWDNPDPLTWVFHLRRNVRFHDGHEMSAVDVVYSLNRLLQHPELDIANYLQYVTSADAVDPQTVRIRTSQPYAVLLNKLRLVAIVPAQATTEALRTAPDGTGPYRFASRPRPDLLHLTRFEGYWGRLPDIADVMFEFERSAARASDELIGGKAQLIRCDSKKLLPRLAAAGFHVEHRVALLTIYVAMSLADRPDNPFHDPAVRDAVNMAIDRGVLADRLPSEALPANQLVPPFIFGYNPLIASPRADPAAARDLLAHAGYPKGFDVELHARNTLVEAASEVARQLASVGIRIRLDLLSAANFYPPARAGKFTMLLTGFACPTGDASDVFNDSIHSGDSRHVFGRDNYANFSDPAVDAQIEESARLQEVSQRRILLQQIMAAVVPKHFWIPLCVNRDTYAIHPGLRWKPRGDGYILAAEILRSGGAP